MPQKYFKKYRVTLASFAKHMHLALYILFIVALIYLPAPSTLLQLNSLTESIDIKVINTLASKINIKSAWSETRGVCVEDIILVPQSGATVSYSKPLNNHLYITTFGQWHSVRNNNNPILLEDHSSYIVGDKTKGCKEITSIRLPANGILTIGSENVYSPNENTLLTLNNELTLYGRAVSHLLGVIPLNNGPFRANSLYYVESLSIPAGSRIANAKTANHSDAQWWGFIDVVISLSKPSAMKAYLTTNAVHVDVFAPAPAIISTSFLSQLESTAPELRPDSISLTHGSRLLGDPNLRWLYAIFTALILLVQLASTVRKKNTPKSTANE